MFGSQFFSTFTGQVGWLAAVGVTGAAVAVALVRGTARQTRLIELALVALLLAPACAWLPGERSISIAWPSALGANESIGNAPQGDAPNADVLNLEQVVEPDAERSRHAVVQGTATVALPARGNELPAAADRAAALPSKLVALLRSKELAVLAALVYFTGCLVCLGRWLAGIALVARLRAGAVRAPLEIEQILGAIAGGKSRKVRLLMSDRISQPIACGLVRPAILLPIAWTKIHPEALRAALAHEYAHVAHADLWWLHLQGLVQSIYWFHPATWWLGRRLRLNQDLLADSEAADCFTSREDYAAILVQLARQALGATPAMAAAWLGSSSTVRRRVCRLLAAASPSDVRCGRAWTAMCLLILLPAAAALGAVRFADEQQPSGAATGTLTISAAGSGATGIEGAATLDVATPQDADPETAQLPIGTIRHNTDGSLSFVGEVIDYETKEPLAGAIVSIRQELPNDSPKARDRVVARSQHKTDAHGRYHFNVSPEHARNARLYMICAGITKDGYAPQGESGYSLSMMLKNRELGEPPFFTRFRLAKGEDITGQLVYANGRPAANVPIDGYSREGRFPDEYGTWLKTRTDADGRFRITVRKKGGIFLRFYPTDAAAGRWIVADGRRGDLGVYSLEPGEKIKGRLLDADGKPLAQQWVQVEEHDDERTIEGEQAREFLAGVYFALVRSALTDAEGRFELAPLLAGKYRLEVAETAHDVHSPDRVTYPLKAVVLRKVVELTGQDEAVEVELRGVPSVEVALQYVDGQGKPRSGWELWLWGNNPPEKGATGDSQSSEHWSAQARADAGGRVVFQVPRGLTNTTVRLVTNEHGSVRWSHGADGELHNTDAVPLGDLTADVTDLVIHRYEAPVVLATLRTVDGAKLTNVKIGGNYAPGRGTSPGQNGTWANGTPFVGDIVGFMMTHQPDGRYRSESMLPDEESSIDVTADGPEGKKYAGSIKLSLPEGETREVEIEMKPAGP